MLIAWLPSSNECRPTGVPVRPIDRANDVFAPDGGSDDPGPYQNNNSNNNNLVCNVFIYIWQA